MREEQHVETVKEIIESGVKTTAKYGCLLGVIAAPFVLPYIAYKATMRVTKKTLQFAGDHKFLTAAALTLGASYYVFISDSGEKIRERVGNGYTFIMNKWNDKRVRDLEDTLATQGVRLVKEQIHTGTLENSNRTLTNDNKTLESEIKETYSSAQQKNQELQQRDQQLQQAKQELNAAQSNASKYETRANELERNNKDLEQKLQARQTESSTHQEPRPAPRTQTSNAASNTQWSKNYIHLSPSQLPRVVPVPEYNNNDGCALHILVTKGVTQQAAADWARNNKGTMATWQEIRVETMKYTPNYVVEPERMPINTILHVPR